MENVKTIDIQHYLQIILRRKWLLIIPTLVGLLGSLIVIANTSPVFESKTIIRVGGRRLLSRSVESVLPGSRGIGNTNLLRRQILSYENIQRLIETLDLKNDNDRKKLIEKDAQAVKAKYPNISIEEIENYLLVNSLQESFTIRQTGNEFIEILAEGNSPTKAYSLATTISQIFFESTLKEELGGIRTALEFSEDQLELYRIRLVESENELEKYKRRQAIEQLDDYEEINDQIIQADSIFSYLGMEFRKKESELEQINNQLDVFLQKVTIPESDDFKKMMNELNLNINKLNNLSMRYSWRSAEIIRLNKNISSQKEDLNDIVRNLVLEKLNNENENQVNLFIRKQWVLVDLEYLKNRKENIIKIRQNYLSKLEEGPTINLSLNRLEQEVAANREIYDLFLKQSRGSQIEQSLQRSEAEYKLRVVEPAQKPIAPTKPNKKIMLLIGLFLGIAIGGGGIFALEYLNQTYQDVHVLEKDLGLPILGIVPKLEINPPVNSRLILLLKVFIPIFLSIVLVFLILKYDLLSVF